MKKLFGSLAVLSMLVGMLAGCGATPEPTQPPPTQTPFVVVVTTTPGPEAVAQAEPTQTPWIIVATPTPAEEVPPEASAETPPSPEPTTPPQPTNTPEPQALQYPPPVLLKPPDGNPISWRNTVTLEWSSVGELAEDEYYHLHLDAFREVTGEHWYGDYVFTKETSYLVDQVFLAPFHPPEKQGEALVYWWVWVVRKTGEDKNGKPLGEDIGTPSEKRFFVTEPKPEDA